jgi:hypothetical protein
LLSLQACTSSAMCKAGDSATRHTFPEFSHSGLEQKQADCPPSLIRRSSVCDDESRLQAELQAKLKVSRAISHDDCTNCFQGQHEKDYLYKNLRRKQYNFCTGIEICIDILQIEKINQAIEFRVDVAKRTAGYLVLDFLLEQLRDRSD